MRQLISAREVSPPLLLNISFDTQKNFLGRIFFVGTPVIKRKKNRVPHVRILPAGVATAPTNRARVRAVNPPDRARNASSMFEAYTYLSSMIDVAAEFPQHTILSANGVDCTPLNQVWTRPLLTQRTLLYVYQIGPPATAFLRGIKDLFVKKPDHVTLLSVSSAECEVPFHEIVIAQFRYDVCCTFAKFTPKHPCPVHTKPALHSPHSLTTHRIQPNPTDSEHEDDAGLSEEETTSQTCTKVGLALLNLHSHPCSTLQEHFLRADTRSTVDTFGVQQSHSQGNYRPRGRKYPAAAHRNLTLVKGQVKCLQDLDIRDLVSPTSWGEQELYQTFTSSLTETGIRAAAALRADLYLAAPVQPTLILPQLLVSGRAGEPLSSDSVEPRVARPAATPVPQATPHQVPPGQDTPATQRPLKRVLQEMAPARATKRGSVLHSAGGGRSSLTAAPAPCIVGAGFQTVSCTHHNLGVSGRYTTYRIAGSGTAPAGLDSLARTHVAYQQPWYALVQVEQGRPHRLVALLLIASSAQPPQIHLILAGIDPPHRTSTVQTILQGFRTVHPAHGLFHLADEGTLCVGGYRAQSMEHKGPVTNLQSFVQVVHAWLSRQSLVVCVPE